MKYGTVVVLAIASLLSLALFVGAAGAGDIETGKDLAKGCRCHKKDLNGKDEADIVKKLEMYRTGEGKSKSMIKKAATLTDEDIANLAAYFSSLK